MLVERSTPFIVGASAASARASTSFKVAHPKNQRQAAPDMTFSADVDPNISSEAQAHQPLLQFPGVQPPNLEAAHAAPHYGGTRLEGANW